MGYSHVHRQDQCHWADVAGNRGFLLRSLLFLTVPIFASAAVASTTAGMLWPTSQQHMRGKDKTEELPAGAAKAAVEALFVTCSYASFYFQMLTYVRLSSYV